MHPGITREDLKGHSRMCGGACASPDCAPRWRSGATRGIPHVRAASVHDAFLAQGSSRPRTAVHMEYDRRRAYGRWAEYAGPSALAQDIQMRRFRWRRAPGPITPR